MYSKRVNGTVHVVEAVVDSERKYLRVMTSYIESTKKEVHRE